MTITRIPALAAILLLAMVCGRAQELAISTSPFHSSYEFQRAHALFDKLQADLNSAQGSVSADLLAQARTGVNRLENNWDRGIYDSAQMYNTILSLEQVVDRTSRLPDRVSLGDDTSRLLDLRREYY